MDEMAIIGTVKNGRCCETVLSRVHGRVESAEEGGSRVVDCGSGERGELDCRRTQREGCLCAGDDPLRNRLAMCNVLLLHRQRESCCVSFQAPEKNSRRQHVLKFATG
jgi:hypothetical protein